MFPPALGTAITSAIVGIIQIPMALYAKQPRSKRWLGRQIIVAWALAAVLYRADGGHWIVTDALLFIGLGLLAFALIARSHFADSLGFAAMAAIVLWSWGALDPSTSLHDNLISALLCFCIIVGTSMCLRAYVNHPPETRMIQLNDH